MFLKKVLALKKEEIKKRKSQISLRDLEKQASFLPPARDFAKSIGAPKSMALIAEIKQASPSAGVIRLEGDLGQRAAQYQAAGASAISVLTERNFFQGELADLGRVKERVVLPVLQKDFIIDPFQIYEGRVSGADAILLIAAALEKEELKEFVILVQSLGLTPLVELHDEEDLEKTSDLPLPLLGINNRNLKTLKVDLQTTLRLAKKVPPGIKVISESGIQSRRDVEILQEAGVRGILVGEVLMRAADPRAKIKELLGS